MRGRSCGVNNNGIEREASNPALYRSELVNGFCHGDDFVTAAGDQIEVFGKMLQEKFDTRRIGMIGAANILTKNWKQTRNMFLDCWEILDLLNEMSLKLRE